MALIHYEGLKTHQHIHKNFRERTLPALEKELERTGYPRNRSAIFSVCAGWLIGHTLPRGPRDCEWGNNKALGKICCPMRSRQ